MPVCSRAWSLTCEQTPNPCYWKESGNCGTRRKILVLLRRKGKRSILAHARRKESAVKMYLPIALREAFAGGTWKSRAIGGSFGLRQANDEVRWPRRHSRERFNILKWAKGLGWWCRSVENQEWSMDCCAKYKVIYFCWVPLPMLESPICEVVRDKGHQFHLGVRVGKKVKDKG